MDLQHKMLRSTIDILINKSILDIQSDTYRSIRNFIDMGVYFAKGKNQKRFFMKMQATIQDPKNPFYKLVCDMLNNIDIDIIKTLGTNLGCSSFTYGVNMIRKKEPELGAHIPPLAFFTWNEGDKTSTKVLENNSRIIAEGMEFGLFTHVFYVDSDMSRARDVFMLAREYPVCTFFMLIKPDLVTDDFLLMTQGVNNVIISVHVTHECEGTEKDVFLKLHDARLMYGFHADYTSDIIDKISSDKFLDELINVGCFFGGYICREKNKNEIPEKMRNFVRNMRTGAGKSILIFDWFDDLNYIINVVSKGGDLIRIDASGKARARTAPPETAIETEGCPLEEIFKAVMPKI